VGFKPVGPFFLIRHIVSSGGKPLVVDRGRGSCVLFMGPGLHHQEVRCLSLPLPPMTRAFTACKMERRWGETLSPGMGLFWGLAS